eukprot:8231807-Alexandrium_andersonii.AAC.1
MATVMANLPREDVVVVEQNWHEAHEKGRVVSMSGFLKTQEELVPKIREAFGGGWGLRVLYCAPQRRSGWASTD